MSVRFRDDPDFNAVPVLQIAKAISGLLDYLPEEYWAKIRVDSLYAPGLTIATFAVYDNIEVKDQCRPFLLDFYELLLDDVYKLYGTTPGQLHETVLDGRPDVLKDLKTTLEDAIEELKRNTKDPSVN